MSYTLLLVDDEDEIRTSIAELVDFKSAGFELVGQAGNGFEALELTERLSPDLILSDIKMPYMTGLEFAAALREVRPSAFIAFLTGYDDFEYARQALEYNVTGYLLKPITPEELTAELIKIRARMDRHFAEWRGQGESDDREERARLVKELAFMKLAFGGSAETGEKERKKLVAEMGFGEDMSQSGEIYVMATGISKFCHAGTQTVAAENNDSEATEERTARLIDGVMRKYFKSQSVALADGTVATLLGVEKQAEKELGSAVRETLELFAKYLKRKAYCGISAPFSSMKHVRRGYKEARIALDSLLGDGEQNEKSESGEMLYASDVEKTKNSRDDDFAAEFGRKLEQLLKTGTEEQILDYLGYVTNKAEARSVDMGGLTANLMMAIYRAAKSVTDQAPPADLFRSGAFADALRSYGEKWTKNGISEICMNAKKYLDERRKNSATQLIDKAKEAINSRFYDSDLNLSSLSEELCCSVPYLSSLVSKSCGVSFVSLLTEKRMEKARELLLGSNMKIAEICERCGYADQHYFSYGFKKYYGVSPAKMRATKGEGEAE